MAQGIARASSPRGGGASKRQRRARARIETERRASGRGGRTSDVVARTRVDARAEPRRRRKTRRGGDSRRRYPRTRSQGGGGGGPEGAREGIRRGGASTRAGRRRGGERGDARRRPPVAKRARDAARLVEKTRAENVALARDPRGGEGSVTRRERGGGGGDEDEEPGDGDERGDEGPGRTRGDEAEVGSPEADSPARGRRPANFDARWNTSRIASGRGTSTRRRLKRRLAGQLAEKDQGEKDATGRGVSEASSAPTSGASSFSRASAERRGTRLVRRAVGLLVAATTLTGRCAIDLGTHRLWRLARAAIVSVSRVMTGSGQAAYNAFSDGAVSSSLALMAHVPDVDVQVSGCRIIASMVASPTMTTHARRAPSFAGGRALRASSLGVGIPRRGRRRREGGGARDVDRRASRRTPRAARDDLRENARARVGGDGRARGGWRACWRRAADVSSRRRSGRRGEARARRRRGSRGGAKDDARQRRERTSDAIRRGVRQPEEWLQGNEGNRGGRKIPNPAPVRKPKGLASGVTSKALEGL